MDLKFSGLTTFKVFGVAALAISLVSIWPGCKDSSATTGATSPHTRGDYVTAIYALPEPHAKLLVNPVTSPVWQAMTWRKLTCAPGHSRIYGGTRVATAMRHGALYAAFICSGDGLWFQAHAHRAELWRHDAAELWLDTSQAQNGTNFLEIVMAPNGRTYECWHRAVAPPQPRANGKINFAYPFSLIPCQISGLTVLPGRGTFRGQSVWTLVVKVPLAHLPRPLRVVSPQPQVGTKFRMNLIRYDWHPAGGKRRLVQYNLFPVATACQAFAPYRMGAVVIGSGQAMNNVALRFRYGTGRK